MHRRYLRGYVQRGDHILKASARARRFTIEFAGLGARSTVGNVSPNQFCTENSDHDGAHVHFRDLHYA